MEDSIERARDHASVEYGELPELARGLRALGSARDGRGGPMQSQFFHALIEARRRAADARTPAARVSAFDVADLSKALERFLDRLLAEWPDKRDSVKRALRAELKERVAPYSAALARLGHMSAAVLEAGEATRLSAWRAWTAQLVGTFQAADLAWLSLRTAVEALPAKKPSG